MIISPVTTLKMTSKTSIYMNILKRAPFPLVLC